MKFEFGIGTNKFPFLDDLKKNNLYNLTMW